MAVSTAVWSSYDDKEGRDCPETPYTYTFLTTTALAGLALLMVPFIRIGKQGFVGCEHADPCEAGEEARSLKMHGHPCAGSDGDNRPSKRWSLVDTASQASSFVVVNHRNNNNNHICNSSCNKSTRAPSSVLTSSSKRSIATTTPTANGDAICGMPMDGPASSLSSTRTAIRRANTGRGNSNNNSNAVVWVVCEDCGTRKKRAGDGTPHPAGHAAAATAVVGDPARYFNDPACGGGGGGVITTTTTTVTESGGGGGGGSGRSPKATTAAVHPVRPYPGRRRLPLVNREAMTYQMLTQGFQP